MPFAYVSHVVAVLLRRQTLCFQTFAAFSQALKRAKRFFWCDEDREFRKNKVWFKTLCINAGSGKASECLLLHDFISDDGKIGVMLPAHIEGKTHTIVLQNDESPVGVRLMVRVCEVGGRE